jgi:plasmid stability protein
MAVVVEIRDVPEEVHRKLEARAAASGQSLSEHLRGVLGRAAARPTPGELLIRVEARERMRLSEPSERAVRRLRDSLD